jgi:type I restriction enzyme S subunit
MANSATLKRLAGEVATVDILLDKLDTFAAAPGGVAKLRELILDLAVRGKLVEQDPDDEPASVLLKAAYAERQRLVKAKILRQSKPRAQPKDEEIPHPLPVAWEWTRLSILGEISPRNDLDDDLDVSFLPMATIADGYAGTIEPEQRKWKEIKKGFTHVADGDIAMAKITPCFQNRKSVVMRGLTNGYGAGTTELHVVRPIGSALVPEFALLQLKSLTYLGVGISKMTGSAGQKRVPKEYFADTPFPLPPLAEQKRIVAKVDELMKLCDELEAGNTRRREVCTAASRSALAHVTSSTTRSELTGAWQRVNDHFGSLYAVPETLSDLRKTILQLAVQGKLVPQDPKDQPAADILKQIDEKRLLLCEAKAIPKAKPLPALDELELPFPLPDSWEWTMLGKLCYQVSDGPHHSPQYVSKDEGIPFLSTRNVRLDSFDLSNVKYVSPEDHAKFSERTHPERGDILYTKGGTTGIARVNDLDFDFSVWVHVAVLKVAKEFVFSQYVAMALNSPFCYVQSQKYTHGSSNNDLGLTRMIKILIPLPPLAEQKRIVAKVDSLLAQLDELAKQLDTRKQTTQQLLEAAVHGVLEGA